MADKAQQTEAEAEKKKAEFEQEKMQAKSAAQKQTMDLAERARYKLAELIRNGNDTTVLIIGLTLAIIKDTVMDVGLDFLGGFGEIPILGQLPGWGISALLIFFMSGKGMLKSKITVKVILYLLDLLPFLVNDLPFTTLSVLYSWNDVKEKALKAEGDMEVLEDMTEAQLQQIAESE